MLQSNSSSASCCSTPQTAAGDRVSGGFTIYRVRRQFLELHKQKLEQQRQQQQKLEQQRQQQQVLEQQRQQQQKLEQQRMQPQVLDQRMQEHLLLQQQQRLEQQKLLLLQQQKQRRPSMERAARMQSPMFAVAATAAMAAAADSAVVADADADGNNNRRHLGYRGMVVTCAAPPAPLPEESLLRAPAPEPCRTDYADTFQVQQPPPSDQTQCVVLHAKGTTRIFLVPERFRQELSDMHRRLGQVSDCLPLLPLSDLGGVGGAEDSPAADDGHARACVAYFPPEAGYFRAYVVRVLAGRLYALVQFVDFGNRCCLPACLLRRCPAEFATVGPPPRAYQCQLAGLCHRQYDRAAGDWLAKRLTEQRVLVEFGLRSPFGDRAWPVTILEPAGLLDGLPADRPESAEFFSEQHRRNVRASLQLASLESAARSSSSRLSGGHSGQRLSYTPGELHRIKSAAAAVSVRPGRLPPADLARRHAAVVLPGCCPTLVRVLPLEAFCLQFEPLHSRLQYLYSELHQVPRKLSPDEVRRGTYCVVRMADDQCYRGRVRSPAFEDTAEVRLVDLGVTTEVPTDRLLTLLPEAADLSPKLVLACPALFAANLTPADAKAQLETLVGRLLTSVRFFSTGAAGNLLVSFD